MSDSQTTDKQQRVFLVRFKSHDVPSQTFVATTVALHGDHLVLLGANGKLVAMFVADLVESCTNM
jgi:hypothetical protein